ncbi:putative LRR receptor-like serine/threonine-protein kinase At3g47570 isoform X2 [Silene latifolia]|uniref:putative LRR receptor-like serine/threonine-protein kinase At3g47570 isoform X2 n=1 Tax=Silene latifolia TaxID=37657 RepID=UPI003D77FF45
MLFTPILSLYIYSCSYPAHYSYHPYKIADMSYFRFSAIYSAMFLIYCFDSSLATTPETDRAALLAIKAKITHDPLGVTSSWNDTIDLCDWHGVTCDQEHHRMRTLNLHSAKLAGELPIDGVFNNASGTSLVGNNRLCGGIPEFKLPSCSFSGKSQNRSRHKIKLVIAILCGCVVVTFLVVIMLLYIFWHGKKKSNPTASADLEKFPNLSYQCLLKATNGFSAENMLGSGGFGVVYKGSLGQDNTLIAIKIFKLENRGASQSFMAECGVLRNIRHRNLIKVITACSSVDYQGRDFKALVYEYMVNGSLDDWLHPKAIKGHDGTNNPTKIRFQPKT